MSFFTSVCLNKYQAMPDEMGGWVSPINLGISSSILVHLPIQGPMTPKLARTGQRLVIQSGHDQTILLPFQFYTDSQKFDISSEYSHFNMIVQCTCTLKTGQKKQVYNPPHQKIEKSTR